MHAPQWACRALYDLHPQLRLAWKGEDAVDEVNPGQFALIQLYHVSDVGDREDSFTVKSIWNTIDIINDSGVVERVRHRLGPLFSKDGEPDKYDFPYGTRFPMLVEYFTVEEVFQGTFLQKVKTWMRPYWERYKEQQKERWKNVDYQIAEKARESVEWGSWATNRTGELRHGGEAKKFATFPKEINPNHFYEKKGRQMPKEAPKSAWIANKKGKVANISTK